MPNFRKDKNDRNDKREKKFFKKRFCRFCKDETIPIDYKDARALTPYITERGKIVPRRVTGTCSYHQSKVTTAIKRARIIALLPFTATQQRWN